MKEKQFKVRNAAGIHCRPSSVIINTINQEYPNNTFVIYSDELPETELNGILSLISLGLQCGAVATLQVEGPDEDEACIRIADLLEYEFDFPQYK
ncbi:MAG: HPr family phosphocarrier protein [Victivallaceae bacterium]